MFFGKDKSMRYVRIDPDLSLVNASLCVMGEASDEVGVGHHRAFYHFL